MEVQQFKYGQIENDNCNSVQAANSTHTHPTVLTSHTGRGLESPIAAQRHQSSVHTPPSIATRDSVCGSEPVVLLPYIAQQHYMPTALIKVFRRFQSHCHTLLNNTTMYMPTALIKVFHRFQSHRHIDLHR